MASAALLLVAIVFSAATAAAPLPPVDRVAFAPAAGAMLPLDARFADEHGRFVRLRDYFGDHPAIVVLGYYGCSNLCSVVLNGLVAGLVQTRLRAGHDFEVIVASIDPRESPALALQRRRAALGEREARGWHFLTGDDEAIRLLTAALDYRYDYDATERQYAHAAGITIVRPDGRVLRALYGAVFSADELGSALQTAASRSDETPPQPARNWLLCFGYDPHTGRYTAAVLTALRVAGSIALAALALFIIRSRARERRKTTDEDIRQAR